VTQLGCATCIGTCISPDLKPKGKHHHNSGYCIACPSR